MPLSSAHIFQFTLTSLTGAWWPAISWTRPFKPKNSRQQQGDELVARGRAALEGKYGFFWLDEKHLASLCVLLMA